MSSSWLNHGPAAFTRQWLHLRRALFLPVVLYFFLWLGKAEQDLLIPITEEHKPRQLWTVTWQQTRRCARQLALKHSCRACDTWLLALPTVVQQQHATFMLQVPHRNLSGSPGLHILGQNIQAISWQNQDLRSCWLGHIKQPQLCQGQHRRSSCELKTSV